MVLTTFPLLLSGNILYSVGHDEYALKTLFTVSFYLKNRHVLFGLMNNVACATLTHRDHCLFSFALRGKRLSGTPKTMTTLTDYGGDVVSGVCNALEERTRAAESVGVPRWVL